jgi:alcohol dehydrogenase
LLATRLALWPSAATFFGDGEVGRLPICVEIAGKRRAFIVTDPGVVAAGVADAVVEVLDSARIQYAIYDGLRPNPDIGALEAGRRALRRFGDAVVVGLGGGTALDAAKGISLAAANDGDVRDLDYRRQPASPGLPLIAIPTTAGTGAETNGFGVIDDPDEHRKFYVGGASVMPRATILDPRLTVGLPPAATAATGMDAFTHALESLSSRRANPYAHGLALQVVRMVARWLPAAVADGSDLEARRQMLLAAHMAGLAFATTGLGLCHAIGHALSARLGTAHGVALAVVLPHVLDFNAVASAEVQLEIAAAMSVASASEAARRLAGGLGIPARLEELGCPRDAIPLLVHDALADEVLANTPRTPTREELTALLETAF